MAEHNGGPAGQLFSAKRSRTQAAARSCRKVRGGNKVTPDIGSSVLAARYPGNASIPDRAANASGPASAPAARAQERRRQGIRSAREQGADAQLITSSMVVRPAISPQAAADTARRRPANAAGWHVVPISEGRLRELAATLCAGELGCRLAPPRRVSQVIRQSPRLARGQDVVHRRVAPLCPGRRRIEFHLLSPHMIN